MEQRWFEIGALVKVKSETECNWQLRGDSLPDGVCGRAGTILPVRSLQGVQISGDRFLPLVFIQLDDGRAFMIHQDNLERGRNNSPLMGEGVPCPMRAREP